MTQTIIGNLSRLDRYLPVWILAAMALGLGLGRVFPGLAPALDTFKVGDVSVPIAAGLLWMMYPVLAKVRYERLGHLGLNRRLFGASLALNWLLGPLLMFALAWLLLPDLPHYRDGLVLIGLARCIAMVLIWNALACGSGEAAAVLVAFNAMFQIGCYAGLGWLFLTVLPTWLGAPAAAFHVSAWLIARSVLIFLGVPFLAGALTRIILLQLKGEGWFESVFLRRVGPTALLGLLYTIVLMFALQGDKIMRSPLDVARIAVPLLAYFGIMFTVSFWWGRRLDLTYEDTTALAFTATGNNFELAIAVAIGVYGLSSGEALAGVVGPLIEVPALVGLVHVALARRASFESLASTRADTAPARGIS